VALSRIAELTAQPEALAALAHALGETTRLDAGPGAAAAEFLRSVELFGPLGLPLATATAQRRAAAILLQAGDPQRGVRLLSAAYQAADRLDAGPLRAQLRTTLAGLGVKPPERRGAVGRDRAGLVTAAARSAAGSSPAGSSPAGLSAREAEVMRLVAAGNTSREIGGQLFLSPRTVEMHVRSSMLKLDCRTRAAAVRRITELGLMEEPAGDRAR
jgi:DNA-binding CsgD family transcriptional regulator